MASQRFIILGTAASLSSSQRDNTSLVFESPCGLFLIDCAANPYKKLLQAGLNPSRLFAVFLTHKHPDHVYGLPSLVHHFVMAKRAAPLTVYANFPTLQAVTMVMKAMALRAPFLTFYKVPEDRGHLLFENDEYAVITTPVRHIVPTLALKIVSKLNGASAVYSSDTGPCPELLALAKETDLLIHECSVSRPTRGHTSPAQLGQLAQWCDVKKLVLVHLWPSMDFDRVISEVKEHFKGEVVIANDFDVYELEPVDKVKEPIYNAGKPSGEEATDEQ